MRDTFSFGRIIDTNRDILHDNSAHGGPHQDLHLEFIATTQRPHPAQFAQRIESKAGLRILQGMPGLDLIPKIRKAVGKGIFGGHVFRRQIPGSYQQAIRDSFDPLNKSGNILGVVLPIRIDGNCIPESSSRSRQQAGSQRISFPAIVRIGDNANIGNGGEQLRGHVGRAVIDHKDIGTIALHPGDHLRQCSRVVVSWNNHRTLHASHPFGPGYGYRINHFSVQKSL